MGYENATFENQVRCRTGFALPPKGEKGASRLAPNHLAPHFDDQPKPADLLHYVDPEGESGMAMVNSWGGADGNWAHAGVRPTGDSFVTAYCGARVDGRQTLFDTVARHARRKVCESCDAKLRANVLSRCKRGGIPETLLALQAKAYRKLATYLPGLRLEDVEPRFDVDCSGEARGVALRIDLSGSDKQGRIGCSGVTRFVTLPDDRLYSPEDAIEVTLTQTVEACVAAVLASESLWEGIAGRASR